MGFSVQESAFCVVEEPIVSKQEDKPHTRAVSMCEVGAGLERLKKRGIMAVSRKVRCFSHSWFTADNATFLFFLLEFEHSCCSLSHSFQLGWYNPK